MSAADFPSLLRQFRQQKQLSQAEVAKRAGVSPGYVGLIETGVRGTRPETILRFARALELPDAETEVLLRAAGLLGHRQTLRSLRGGLTTEEVIEMDPRLTSEQKELMRTFYVAITKGRRKNST